MTFSEFEAMIPSIDLWEYLSETNKPIVMYGMGNGADKIIAELAKYGVTVSDFFASDGFVRGQLFHGRRVVSYSEICSEYKEFIILVTFGSKLDEVISFIENLSAEHELYLPDVPVSEDQIFNLDFYNLHKNDIKKCYDILADEKSKDIFLNTILYKLTGKIEYLLRNTEDEEKYIKEIFDTDFWKTYVDLGAYNGDTIKQTLKIAPSVNSVIALEPDAKNFKKLSAYVDGLTVYTEIYNLCAWNQKDKLKFERSGNRNSAVNRQSHTPSVGDTEFLTVNSNTVDSIINGRTVDYIKFDVEGAEREALEGSMQTIFKNAPDILMAIYHKSRDLFELPLIINKILPEDKLFIRRKRCLPAWEINVLAKKDLK